MIDSSAAGIVVLFPHRPGAFFGLQLCATCAGRKLKITTGRYMANAQRHLLDAKETPTFHKSGRRTIQSRQS